MVRDGKGGKDRSTVLPQAAVQPLLAQLGKVRRFYTHVMNKGGRGVTSPSDRVEQSRPRMARP